MEGTYLVSRVRVRTRSRRRVRIGAPDPSLTGVAGMAASSELVERLGVIALLDAAIGPIKQRARGHGAGGLLVGLAAAQLAGADHLVSLDRHRADVAGQVLTPVPGLGSTTAVGLARRLSAGQWAAMETGLAAVTVNRTGIPRGRGSGHPALLGDGLTIHGFPFDGRHVVDR